MHNNNVGNKMNNYTWQVKDDSKELIYVQNEASSLAINNYKLKKQI